MVQLAHPVHTASFACNVTESLPPRVVRVCLPSHPAGKFLSNHGSIASILRRPSPPRLVRVERIHDEKATAATAAQGGLAHLGDTGGSVDGCISPGTQRRSPGRQVRS